MGSILVNAVKHGRVDYDYGNKDVDAIYSLGDGDHTVSLEGNGSTLTTGNGNSTIVTEGDECSVYTGDGDNKITATGDNNTVKTGDGDNYVTTIGDNNKTTVGDGDNYIVHYGTGGSIKTGDGDNTIVSIGDDKTIKTGSGDDDVTFLGDNCDVNTGDGDNNLVFYGNNCTIQTGDGNDNITTYDQVYQDEDYSDLADAWYSKLPDYKWKKINYTKLSAYVPVASGGGVRYKKVTFASLPTSVENMLSKYVGVKNTKIDTGKGEDTANVTLSSKSKIKTYKSDDGTKDDSVTKNKAYTIHDEDLGQNKFWTYVLQQQLYS